MLPEHMYYQNTHAVTKKHTRVNKTPPQLPKHPHITKTPTHYQNTHTWEWPEIGRNM